MMEMKQTNIETELYLLLQQKSCGLHEQVMELLRPFQLSTSQYNILRILRGAGETGCTCGEIAERMITKDPDITRLLDRLIKRDCVSRTRCDEDRRVVKSFITKQGLKILSELDQPVEELHIQQFTALNEGKKTQLKTILENIG